MHLAKTGHLGVTASRESHYVHHRTLPLGGSHVSKIESPMLFHAQARLALPTYQQRDT